MASTIGLVGRAVQQDEVLNGLKRSRFSLHFNARRVLHWVRVHLVGVPAQTGNEQETTSTWPVQFRGARTTIARLVDDYMAVQFTRRLA